MDQQPPRLETLMGHLSCEHIVHITQTNLLTIQTSTFKEHCHLKSVLFCPDLTECFKDKLKLCSISNSTKKMFYSLEGIGKYFIECGTDNTKEVDLTEKDCKKTNSSLENATPNPYPESASTSPNVWYEWLIIGLAVFALVVLAFGLYACYKKKERSARSNVSTNVETSTSAPNMELHAFIRDAEEANE